MHSEQEIEQQLLEQLKEHIKKSGMAFEEGALKKAFAFTQQKHETQKRNSGEPYLVHPVNVACIIADMGIDATCVTAALLHDTLEDTDTTREELEKEFGPEVVAIVEGLTKIARINTNTESKHQSSENIRKMLFAMTRDIRVIFIKLADRLHNMRTMNHMPPEKQQRIAKETLEIYAPLANRLGIGWIKNELEDNALKYLDSSAYYKLKKQIEEKLAQRTSYVNSLIEELNTVLDGHGLHFQIKGRAKHFYSIYKKMEQKKKDFEEIHDLTALRIITDTIQSCYQILGLIHSSFTPLYDRFKDYISIPKSNMYSSLHTTVIGPQGKLLEIQIRTEEMDQLAEEGAASHLLYKTDNKEKKSLSARLVWLKKLKNWQKSLTDPQGFMEEVQEDLLQDEIYVFTPKGEIKKLPTGATPVDFAYSIHSEIGQHCIGAKTNGKIVPLNTKLKNCDIVEVLTSRNAHPTSSWLKFVKSSRTKAKIRSYLKNFIDTSHLLQEVNKNQQPPPAQKHKAKPIKISAPREVYLDGDQNLLFEFARCCNPAPGDEIIGYISRGRGIIIHKSDCSNVPYLLQEKERIVKPSWKHKENKKELKFSLIAKEGKYVLAEIVSIISSNNAGIISVQRNSLADNNVKVDLIIEINSVDEWKLVRKGIAQHAEIIKLIDPPTPIE